MTIIHYINDNHPLTQQEKKELAFQHDMWEDLKVCYGWKIYKQYPYYIRRAHSCDFLLCSFKNDYLHVEINGIDFPIHRVIATQWIPNPARLPIVDHIDGKPMNNHISNLRWVSKSDNSRNIHSIKGQQIELLSDVPDSCKPLDIYNNERFDNVYIDIMTKDVYVFNGISFKRLSTSSTSKGNYVLVDNYYKQKRRVYVERAYLSIIHSKPNIINITTTQGFIIEYIDTLPLNAVCIKEFNNIKLKRMYWFDPSCDRIILLNNNTHSSHEYKYRYIRSIHISLYYYNGNIEQVPTHDLLKQMNPTTANDTKSDTTYNEASSFMDE